MEQDALSTDDRLEFGLSTRFFILRLAWVVPIALGVTGLALYVLLAPKPEAARESVQVALIWLFYGVVMLVVMADAVRVMRLRGAVVTIDADGVFDRRLMRKPLPWRDIRKAEIRTMGDRPLMVGFWPKQRARDYYIRLPLFGYFGIVYVLQVLAAPFRFAPIPIDLPPLAEPPQPIIDAVRRYWGEPEIKPILPKREEDERQ
ncbi:MAG: hypothetical protein MRY74_02580 [Neomegalonema sp.]|nr:hypothetical protein [Neomegalonema sp.]